VRAAALFAAYALFRLLAPLLRSYLRHSSRTATSIHGLRLVGKIPDESNAALLEAKLKGALDFLSVNAPVHLRWLRRRYTFLFLGDVRGGGWIQHVPDVRMLRVNPQLIWRMGTEPLAVELAGAAGRGRLCRSVASWTDYDEHRLRRVEDEERIWVARRVPEPIALGKDWSEFLAQNPERPTAERRSHDKLVGRGDA
jgi:hypothetical protein